MTVPDKTMVRRPKLPTPPPSALSSSDYNRTVLASFDLSTIFLASLCVELCSRDIDSSDDIKQGLQVAIKAVLDVIKSYSSSVPSSILQDIEETIIGYDIQNDSMEADLSTVISNTKVLLSLTPITFYTNSYSQLSIMRAISGKEITILKSIQDQPEEGSDVCSRVKFVYAIIFSILGSEFMLTQNIEDLNSFAKSVLEQGCKIGVLPQMELNSMSPILDELKSQGMRDHEKAISILSHCLCSIPRDATVSGNQEQSIFHSWVIELARCCADARCMISAAANGDGSNCEGIYKVVEDILMEHPAANFAQDTASKPSTTVSSHSTSNCTQSLCDNSSYSYSDDEFVHLPPSKPVVPSLSLRQFEIPSSSLTMHTCRSQGSPKKVPGLNLGIIRKAEHVNPNTLSPISSYDSRFSNRDSNSLSERTKGSVTDRTDRATRESFLLERQSRESSSRMLQTNLREGRFIECSTDVQDYEKHTKPISVESISCQSYGESAASPGNRGQDSRSVIKMEQCSERDSLSKRRCVEEVGTSQEFNRSHMFRLEAQLARLSLENIRIMEMLERVGK